MAGDREKKARPDLTIVGGQPKRRHRFGGKIKVPVGLEKLLYHAAGDDEFRSRLMEDRAAAVAESGVRLRASEEGMLRVIPDAALETMIDGIVPENPRRRKFMGLVAAAAASLAAGTAASGCDDDTATTDDGPGATMGIGPDVDVDGDTDSDSDTDSDTDKDGGTDAAADSDSESDTDSVDTDFPSMDGGGALADDDVDGI